MYDKASWVKPQWPLFVFYAKSRQEISMKQIFIDVNVMTKYTVDFFCDEKCEGGEGGGDCVFGERTRAHFLVCRNELQQL